MLEMLLFLCVCVCVCVCVCCVCVCVCVFVCVCFPYIWTDQWTRSIDNPSVGYLMPQGVVRSWRGAQRFCTALVSNSSLANQTGNADHSMLIRKYSMPKQYEYWARDPDADGCAVFRAGAFQSSLLEYSCEEALPFICVRYCKSP